MNYQSPDMYDRLKLLQQYRHIVIVGFSADQYRRQPLNELKSPLIGAGDAGPSLLRRDIDSDAGTNLRLPLDPHRSETV